jgi:MFS family permease
MIFPSHVRQTISDDQAVQVADVGSLPRRWSVGTLSYTIGGLIVLFFWLLWGDFALNLKDRAVPPTLQLLLRQYHASDFTAGALVGTLPHAIAVLVLPIVGYWSDRHRGRWGRRIPFLLGAAPLATIAMIGLAMSPVIGRTIHHSLGASEDSTVIGCFGFSWMLFEFSSIVCASLFVALINDVVPHSLLGRFFGMFRVISLGAGMIFQYFIFGIVEAHFVGIFLAIGVLYGVSFCAMCWRVREGSYPASPRPEPAKRDRFVVAVRQYVRDCFSDPYYLWFFLAVALANMAFAPINLFHVYLAQSLHMSMRTLGKFGTLQLLLSLVQAYPAGWLADKIHPLRLTILASALYAIVTLLAFFLIHDALTFGVMYVISGTCAGFWLTVFSPLAPLLLPKLKYAEFAGAMGIFSSLGMMIIGPACGKFLDYAHHDYRYIYLWAFALIFSSFLASLVLHTIFLTHARNKLPAF